MRKIPEHVLAFLQIDTYQFKKSRSAKRLISCLLSDALSQPRNFQLRSANVKWEQSCKRLKVEPLAPPWGYSGSITLPRLRKMPEWLGDIARHEILASSYGKWRFDVLYYADGAIQYRIVPIFRG